MLCNVGFYINLACLYILCVTRRDLHMVPEGHLIVLETKQSQQDWQKRPTYILAEAWQK